MMKLGMATLLLLGLATASEAQMPQSVQKPSIEVGVASLNAIDFSDSWNGNMRTFDDYDIQTSSYEMKSQLRQTLFDPAVVSMVQASYPPSLNSGVLPYTSYQSKDKEDIWEDHGKEIAIVAVALLVVVLVFN